MLVEKKEKITVEEKEVVVTREKKKISFENLSFWTIGLVVFLLPIFFLLKDLNIV